MGTRDRDRASCAVCGKSFPKDPLIPAEVVRDEIADEIREDLPDWSDGDVICPKDLAVYRARYVEGILASEKGDLSSLEERVILSLREHDPIAMDVAAEFQEDLSFGDRLADQVAAFGGSWTFIGWFAVVLVVWIVLNSLVLYLRPVDPYPFILLNLVLSCLAAIQAPIIMMSQNRQEDRDRLQSRHDYEVNLKAELEIRHLHEKIDHLLHSQWERLVEIEKVQLGMLEELERQR